MMSQPDQYLTDIAQKLHSDMQHAFTHSIQLARNSNDLGQLGAMVLMSAAAFYATVLAHLARDLHSPDEIAKRAADLAADAIRRTVNEEFNQLRPRPVTVR